MHFTANWYATESLVYSRNSMAEFDSLKLYRLGFLCKYAWVSKFISATDNTCKLTATFIGFSIARLLACLHLLRTPVRVGKLNTDQRKIAYKLVQTGQFFSLRRCMVWIVFYIYTLKRHCNKSAAIANLILNWKINRIQITYAMLLAKVVTVFLKYTVAVRLKIFL